MGGWTNPSVAGGGTITGNVTIKGDLTVQGTTTSVVNQTTTGKVTIDVADANALAVGPNGETNPTWQVDTVTASAATGLKLTSAAAAAGVALAVVSSGADENLTIDAKGSGTISIGATSTGAVGIGIAPVSGTRLTLPLEADAVTPTLAFGDGDSGFYESVDDSIVMASAGIARFQFNGAFLRAVAAGSNDPNPPPGAGKGWAHIFPCLQLPTAAGPRRARRKSSALRSPRAGVRLL